MMILPEDIKRVMPPLFSTRKQKDPWIVCRFVDPVGIAAWYVLEGKELSEGNYLFYAYIMSSKTFFGYVTLFQLMRMKDGMWSLKGLPIERDMFFTPCKLSEVMGK